MKMWKNNLDEMQEQKLLKIEHNGCWIAFWGLLIVMPLQMLLFGAEAKTVAGEWLVFMVLCLYLVIDCARAGIYDRHIQTGWKSSMVASLIAGFALGLFVALMMRSRFDTPLGVTLASAGMTMAFTAALCFAGLMFIGRIVKKRQAALEKEPEEE